MSYFSSGITLNKLSVLYFLRALNLPLTSQQLVEFDAREAWMGYFNMKQALADLIESGLLTVIDSALGESYVLSDEGLDAIGQFEKRIPDSQRSQLDALVRDNKPNLLKERRYSSSMKKEAPLEYRLKLKAFEDERSVLELSLVVTSREIAKRVCDEWSVRAPVVYKSIMTQLLPEE